MKKILSDLLFCNALILGIYLCAQQSFLRTRAIALLQDSVEAWLTPAAGNGHAPARPEGAIRHL